MSQEKIDLVHYNLYEEKIDDDITPTILEIIKFQNKIIAMSNELLDKFAELDKKYKELRKPIYEMITEIIKSIPNFWVHLFSSNLGLRIRLGEVDFQILKYMTSMKVEDTFDLESGYSITFEIFGKERNKKRRTELIESFFYELFDEDYQGVERNDDPVCKVYQVPMSHDLCTAGVIKLVWDDILRYIKEVLIKARDEGEALIKVRDEEMEYKLKEVEDMLSKNRNDLESAKSEVHKEFLRSCKLICDMRNECIKSCPDFWMKAFFGYPALDKHVRPEDREIFMYLTSIEVEDQDPTDLSSDTSISFSFSPNPYFEDTKLTKTFKWVNTSTFEATAVKINWKEGKSVLTGLDYGKERNERPRIKESFFNWFIETYEDKDFLLPKVAGHIKMLWSDPVKYYIKYVKGGAFKSGDGDKKYVATDVDNGYDDELYEYHGFTDDDDW